MGGWGIYFLFLVPPLLLGLWVQHRLKKTFAEQAQVQVANGMTGAQVARAILDANGLHEVPVAASPGGPLSDHYDPRKRSVHLSQPVHDEVSVSATAVAAHEVGPRDPAQGGLLLLPVPLGPVPRGRVLVEHLDVPA